jgi:hypothetical protein
MIKIADLINNLSQYQEAQRQLEQARNRATGDKDYYSYCYIQDLKRAEEGLEHTLDAYIDQRIAEKTLMFSIPHPELAADVEAMP